MKEKKKKLTFPEEKTLKPDFQTEKYSENDLNSVNMDVHLFYYAWY